ncbi:PepSY-associated TM helix domain-containing protein [Hyphomonas polymorpha PS728]|uniref:PepSY-associated TM helix domain-containing protein n=1 Tax=Hyphomonas polymorpha PS728 TaxID=1280954 RepID=A0A062VET1_9PROT|nr:PepSY-associated TM helix domain-containing protein [Hyphomonas polymorpha]KCZ97013.1 PepSY-associated TM helix domain-containing protein [Hyphomonas polymorpha PS728]
MAEAATKNTWLVLHRWFGIITALFLFIAALTGSILTARSTLDRWANGDLFTYDGSAADRLPPIEAVALYEAANPGIQVTGFPLSADETENILITVAPKPGEAALDYDEVFLNPATGEAAGMRSTDPGLNNRQLIPLILELHYNLLAGDTGRIFMGFVALGWLISSGVGLYLTFPRKGPFFKNWWPSWVYSPKRSFARQMLDIHRASALWLFPFLFILAFTSVTLNFFDEFWDPFATTVAPLEKSLFHLDAPYPDGTTPAMSYADALALSQAQAAAEGIAWKPATMLYYQNWNLYGTTFSDTGDLNYKYLGPIYYYFDAATGDWIHEVNPYTDSAGLVMIRAVYPLHSGEIGGGLAVFFVFILGLATAEQCFTGIWVWLKKRGPRIAAKRKAHAAATSA